MYPVLTTKQQDVRIRVAHGYSAKEIADQTGNTVNTINTHIRNIKLVRELQKISEIAADYWCEVFGTTLDEQRKSIASALACLILLFTLPIDNEDKRRTRLRSRRHPHEYINEIPSTI